MTTSQRFDTKDPGEEVILTYDFTAGLAVGETLIGTASTVVKLALGNDPTPAAILNGAPSFDALNQKVFVPVQGGLDGVDYDVVITVQTSNPKKEFVLGWILPVRNQ